MTPSSARPTAIRRVAADGGERIEIEWSDGATGRYPPKLLRESCPCATCREKRAAPRPSAMLEVLRPEDLVPLTVAGMEPVGQYAYSIAFSDGHDTGIYTLDYLRELADANP
ncbi:MAG: gamma-butyrobetaine hydroxylase-like domain-containing protein [Planctomycetota bacterium]|nr:DUF971 domain-containing protein [Planctomycetota bacterium]